MEVSKIMNCVEKDDGRTFSPFPITVGHPMKLLGGRFRADKRWFIQRTINWWSLLPLGVEVTASIHGSQGELDNAMEVTCISGSQSC